MSGENQSYTLHPVISRAYQRTLNWIAETKRFNGNTNLKWDDIESILNTPSYPNAAFLFRALFPAHHFKVVHSLQSVVGLERLANLVQSSLHICVVDVGCGTGAASIGIISALLDAIDRGQLSQNISLYCIGVDPDECSLEIYKKIMTETRKLLQKSQSKLQLEFDFEPLAIPDATERIKEMLEVKRKEWQQPRLGLAFLFQVNVVRPLSASFEANQTKRKRLKGSAQSNILEPEFGRIEALNYRSIFEGSRLDFMSIVTVGTDQYMLPERVRQMGDAIQRAFSEGEHRVSTDIIEPQRYSFYDPEGSLWYAEDCDEPCTPKPFHLNVSFIENLDIVNDSQWASITNLDNLHLAFFRVRQQMFREPLVDETEIRLFESDLTGNLSRLRQELIAYAQMLYPGDLIVYRFPKSEVKARPRALSRLEEEILSVAIIQAIGQDFSSRWDRSYAYRISGQDRGRETEYLYQNWWDAYQLYLHDARHTSSNMSSGCVLRVDVSSFFERIVQESLMELVNKQLSPSQRVMWLLRLLLYRNIPEHELRQGLLQEGISSGFYANIYLTPVDELFGTSNPWGAKIFRYVDDIIVTIPDCQDLLDVKQAIIDKLVDLGLDINPDKTEEYSDPAAFLAATELDARLNALSEQCERALNKLWILDGNLRALFQQSYPTDSLWWYRLGQYQRCLVELGVHISRPELSRRVFRYLYNDERRRRNLDTESELQFPDLLDDTRIEYHRQWAEQFRELNPEWNQAIEALRGQLTELFLTCYNELLEVENDPVRERLLQRRIRFSANKLTQFGLDRIHNELAFLLCTTPWRVRDPSHSLEDLASQGFVYDIQRIFLSYQDSIHPMRDYMRAVCARAFRFLPILTLENWTVITGMAITGSPIERLMATETWLCCERNPDDSPVSIDQILMVIQLLENEVNLSPRLKKNYVLILSLYSNRSDLDIDLGSWCIDDEPLINNANRIVRQGLLSELYDYDEPDVIRHNYYSGRQPYQEGWEYSF